VVGVVQANVPCSAAKSAGPLIVLVAPTWGGWDARVRAPQATVWVTSLLGLALALATHAAHGPAVTMTPPPVAGIVGTIQYSIQTKTASGAYLLSAAGAQHCKPGAQPARARESTTQQFLEEMSNGASTDAVCCALNADCSSRQYTGRIWHPSTRQL
jgi:hypothetical protein